MLSGGPGYCWAIPLATSLNSATVMVFWLTRASTPESRPQPARSQARASGASAQRAPDVTDGRGRNGITGSPFAERSGEASRPDTLVHVRRGRNRTGRLGHAVGEARRQHLEQLAGAIEQHQPFAAGAH